MKIKKKYSHSKKKKRNVLRYTNLVTFQWAFKCTLPWLSHPYQATGHFCNLREVLLYSEFSYPLPLRGSNIVIYFCHF